LNAPAGAFNASAFEELDDRALRGRAQTLDAIHRHVDVAATDRLAGAGVDDRGARDEEFADRGPEVVDLELGRDDRPRT